MENRDDELFSPVTGKKGDDVIRGAHQLVTCSGESEGASQSADPLTWAGDQPPGPIRSCAEAGEGVGPTLTGEVISCHRAECASSCGGGASGGTHLYLDKTQEAVTSDLSPDSDEVFTTDLPPPPGERSPPTSAPASAAPPQSRNTFACGQSAAGQLIQEETESELQSRRPDILEFFSR